jgi:lipase maturation factor 1
MASTWDAFLAAPTLLWFTGCSDWMLQAIPVLGMVVAAIPAIFGCANMILLSMLWILYHSYVRICGLCGAHSHLGVLLSRLNSVGQNWYSFGWESQLLETGFLAVWVVPVLTLHPLPKHTPVPSPIVFCFRWLLFRIMLGAVRMTKHLAVRF